MACPLFPRPTQMSNSCCCEANPAWINFSLQIWMSRAGWEHTVASGLVWSHYSHSPCLSAVSPSTKLLLERVSGYRRGGCLVTPFWHNRFCTVHGEDPRREGPGCYRLTVSESQTNHWQIWLQLQVCINISLFLFFFLWSSRVLPEGCRWN